MREFCYGCRNMENELLTIGILFFFAIIGGIIAKRVRQPTVIGLLLIGAVIGPNALGIVNSKQWIDLIIEMGAILLLFVVGLEFDLPKLLKLGFKALAMTVLKVGIAFFIGFHAAVLLGFDVTVGIFIGFIISFSSTVVIVKVLEQKAMYNRRETPLLLTILIFEDVFAVIALIFFSSLKNNLGANMLTMGEHIILALTTLIIAYLVMLHLAKYIFTWLMKNSTEDITTYLALGLCAGFSALAYGLGLSPSAGAFLAGSIIASMPQAKSFEHAISPYALIFSSLFFIAMGTLVNFHAIQENMFFIAVLLGAVLLSRFIAIGLVSYVFAGFKSDEAFFSSFAMLSIGEFALLIAKEGAGFGIAIDLVTITSVLIFISALMMSMSIAYSTRIHNTWATTKPAILNNTLSQLSSYVRNFFDQIDTENRNTRNFKTSLMSSIFTLLILIYLFVGWNKVIGILDSFNIFGMIVYGVHSLFILFICLDLYSLYKRVLTTQEALIRVLTTIDRMMNHRKSRLIVENLLLAGVFFFIALFFPLGIFLFALPLWTTGVSFVLLAISLLYLNGAIRLLKTYSSVSYASGRLYHGISLQDLYKTKNPLSLSQKETQKVMGSAMK